MKFVAFPDLNNPMQALCAKLFAVYSLWISPINSRRKKKRWHFGHTHILNININVRRHKVLDTLQSVYACCMCVIINVSFITMLFHGKYSNIHDVCICSPALLTHTKKTLPWTVSLYNWICMGKRLFTRSIASVGQDPRMPFISGHLSG